MTVTTKPIPISLQSSRVISVADVIASRRKFRGGIFGEPDSGKSATSGTLTPGRDTCVIVVCPESQMITRHPDERLFIPKTFDEIVQALRNPEAIFGDIGTLVWDDATITISKGLSEKGILTSSDPRLAYKSVLFQLEPALLQTINKPFHFVIVAQARKLMNEVSQVEELTFDVPPSMENMLTQFVDYAFFVNKPKQLGEAPTLQLVPGGRRMMTKIKLTREQWRNPPLTAQEPADLARIWAKLST